MQCQEIFEAIRVALVFLQNFQSVSRCQICERLAFHTPTRRMMQKMKFVDSIHQTRFKYQHEKDCVRAVKMCISQLSSLA